MIWASTPTDRSGPDSVRAPTGVAASTLVCSTISSASSPSIPRYRTVLSSLLTAGNRARYVPFLIMPCNAMCQPAVLACRHLRRAVDPARKQVVTRRKSCRLDPRFHARTCLLRDLELERPPRHLLHDGCSHRHARAVANVRDSQPREIARPKLAVDRQIEQCQVLRAARELKTDTNRTDLTEFQRWLLAGQLSLGPWHAPRAADVKSYSRSCRWPQPQTTTPRSISV